MKIRFSTVIWAVAITLATCAGFISVYGMSQMFAGYAIAIMICMSVLELSKIIVASLLDKHWNTIGKSLRIYLISGLIGLMIITSAGIYGFLSGAYQGTASKYSIEKSQISIVESKKEMFENTIKSNEKIIENKNHRINQLTDLRVNQEGRLDSLIKHNNWTNVKKSRVDIELANTEIQRLTSDVDKLSNVNTSLTDSINSYQIKILAINANSQVSSELGPLIYLSELTGKPMDSVINWVILLLIFVFDPMAITLVISANRVREIEDDKLKKDKPEIIYSGSAEGPHIAGGVFSHAEGNGTNPEKQIEVIKSATKKALESKEASIEMLTHAGIINNPEIEADGINEEIEKNTEEVIEVPVVEPVIESSPAIEDKKEESNIPKDIKRSDIKEIKEEKRGFSVNIPRQINRTVDKTSVTRLDNKGDYDMIVRNK